MRNHAYWHAVLIPCAAALLCSSPVRAAAPIGFAGTFSGNYQNVSAGGGSSGNVWGIDGAGAFGLNYPNLGAEIDGGYHNLSVSGFSADLWNIGGSLFWAGFPGRAGVTIGYDSVSGSVSGATATANATTYGVFGEYYFSDMLTAGLKGGGSSGSGNAAGFGFSGSASGSGGYIGGGLTGYIMPDLALSATISYLSGSGHSTNFAVGAEYLFSDALPLTVSGGYMNTQVSGGHADTWLLALTFYTGTVGTLRDHDRNGTLGWIGNSGIMESVH